MKKLLSLLLVLSLSLSLVACDNSSSEKKSSGMPNPMTEVDSIEELNEEVGVELKECTLKGSIDNSIAYIDCNDYKLADYKFSIDDLSFTYRAAKTDLDITGIYPTDFDGTLGETIEEKNVKATETADGYVWSRWYIGDIQYTLTSSEITLDEFNNVLMNVYNALEIEETEIE